MEVEATAHTQLHLTPRLGAVGAAAAADQAVVQSHAGRNQVRLYRIHLHKLSLSHQSEKPLRLEQRSNLIFVMFSYVMLGTIVKEQLKSSTVYLRLLVSKFGSAKKILDLACQ
jgi:hypothetical protein